MNPIVETAVKLLASSALLTAFYLVLFRGKASHRASRAFLLSIPALSLLLSLVSIEGRGEIFSFASLAMREPPAAPALPEAAEHGAIPETVVPEMLFTEVMAAKEATAGPGAVLQTSPELSSPEPPAPGQAGGGAPPVGHTGPRFRQVALPLLYLVVTAVIAGMIARQMFALRRIRRRAERRVVSGSAIYFSRDVRSAFSVMRSIYVGADTPEGKLAIVIRHEREHISRRHYVDLAVMELFTLLLWFNPLVWIVRRELRSVHEFEADLGTLQSGVSVRDYMLAILEETAGNIPVMANGLKSSIIKKRFLKMKTPGKIRLRALRSALTVPFAAALLLFFAFRPAAEPKIATGPRAAGEQSFTLPAPLDTETSDLPFPRIPAPRVVAEAVKPDTIFISVPNGELKIHGMTMRADTMQVIMNGDVSFENFADLRIAMDSVLSSTEFKAKIAEMRNAFSSSEFKMQMDSMRMAFSSPEYKVQMDSLRSVFENFRIEFSNENGALLNAGQRFMFGRNKRDRLTVNDFPAGFDFAYHRFVVMPDGRVVSMNDGVEIGGVTWALTNVGGPGAFAARPEDFGGYYKHSEAVCPEGWRLPTIQEINSLAASGSRWTTVNGVVGREYGSGANTIFLPAAGRWSAKQDKKIYVGENGFYWTSTRVGAGSAHDLLFNEGFSGHQQGHGMDGGGVIQRRNGLSVRCVKQ